MLDYFNELCTYRLVDFGLNLISSSNMDASGREQIMKMDHDTKMTNVKLRIIPGDHV